MPVEQGLPWHPGATGLAGQAIPFCRCLPCARSPIPSILVPCPGCLSCLAAPPSLSAVLARVPLGVARASCVSVLLLPLSVGAPGCPFAHPLLSHPPAPPCADFTSLYDVDCPMHGWLVTALLPPPPPPVVGTSRRSPRPCGVRGHLVEGGGEGGCLLMARSACAAFGGCCGARTPPDPPPLRSLVEKKGP